MLLFLVLPLLALIHHGPESLAPSLRSSESVQAIIVSFRTTSLSLLLVLLLGTPVAILLSERPRAAQTVLGVLVEAPIVLPPAAAGIGLLLAFGRKGIVPTELPFTMGAVVLAQVFVSAPLYIRPLAASIQALDCDWRDAAAIDGASEIQVLRWITLPLVRASIVSGGVMAWARSLGEFGATILFAGNLMGKTQTMPLAIYLGLETSLDQAVGLSLILLAIAFVVLVLVRILDSFARS